MFSKTQLAKKYFKYLLTASNGEGHGIHSPFVFDFVENVLNDKRNFYAYEKIEALRSILKTDNRILEVEDFGAGSVISKTKNRAVSTIAKTALKPKKFGQLLFRMVNYYQPKNIVELGTSLGITTSYLAMANSKSMVSTFEGSENIADVAHQNFNSLGIKNISQIIGNFDETFPEFLTQKTVLDFVFVDGNHREEPTLRYFEEMLPNLNEKSIVIFDDVHWSQEMEAAWIQIKKHPSVKLSIDLFFIGILFFNPDFKEVQHFKIRF